MYKKKKALDPEVLRRIYDFFNEYATGLPAWKPELKASFCERGMREDYEKIKHPLNLLRWCDRTDKEGNFKDYVKSFCSKLRWLEYYEEYQALQKEIEEED